MQQPSHELLDWSYFGQTDEIFLNPAVYGYDHFDN
jgi:hypothetical protein